MKRFLQNDRFIFLFIFALAMVFRLWEIEIRPLHHDESLHALYSKYLYFKEFPHFYEYRPMLHGPLLYYLTAPFLYLFGEGHFTLRLLPALLGSFLASAPWFLRTHLGKTFSFMASLYLCFSPYFLYWSRFLRHDLLFLTVLTSILIILLNRKGKKEDFFIGLLCPLLFTIKENAYLYPVFILAFLTVKYLFHKTGNERLPFSSHFVVGFTGGVAIYVLLYSQFLTYPQGILDGLYQKSLFYWLAQHGQERISGPFSYQFLMLLWYAPLWMMGLFTHILFFYTKRPFLFLLPLFSIAPATFLSPELLNLTPLKLKIPMDAPLFFFLLSHGVLVTVIYLSEKKNLLALGAFALFSHLFTYSFVGEKVPWLALYPFFVGILFLGLEARFEILPRLRKKSFNSWSMATMASPFVLVGSFSLWLSFDLNYGPLQKRELIHQVHTSRQYEDLAFRLQKNLKTRKDYTVYSKSENTWPLSWYLYGLRGFHYHEGRKELEEYNFILTKHPDPLLSKQLRGKFQRKKITLRQWWSPKFDNITLGSSLRYLFWREPWNSPGRKLVTIFEKKSGD